MSFIANQKKILKEEELQQGGQPPPPKKNRRKIVIRSSSRRNGSRERNGRVVVVIYRRLLPFSLSLSPVCFANHDARIWIQAPAHLDFQCSHFTLQVVVAWPRGWLE